MICMIYFIIESKIIKEVLNKNKCRSIMFCDFKIKCKVI